MTSPFREEQRILAQSAARQRTRPCSDGSPYFPNYDDDIMQILIHMARVQMRYPYDMQKTEEQRRVYHDCLNNYMTRLTADPNKLADIYRKMYMDSLTSPNLRRVFHITEEEGRVAADVSVARSLRFSQGSLFLVTQAGEVLMGVHKDEETGERSLRYISDEAEEQSARAVITQLITQTLPAETHEFEGADHQLTGRMILNTQLPLIDCSKQRMYFTHVIRKAFLTKRALFMTPERLCMPDEDLPFTSVCENNQHYTVRNAIYDYQDMVYALINPYSKKMVFTLVYEDGERRSYEQPGWADKEDIMFNQAVLMEPHHDNSNTYETMRELENYLTTTAEQIYQHIHVPGKPILRLEYTCEPDPQLYFHRWISLPQLCTLYGATAHPHEHIARHMYLWFLYDQLRGEDLDEIARLTYSTCVNQRALHAANPPEFMHGMTDGPIPDPHAIPAPPALPAAIPTPAHSEGMALGAPPEPAESEPTPEPAPQPKKEEEEKKSGGIQVRMVGPIESMFTGPSLLIYRSIFGHGEPKLGAVYDSTNPPFIRYLLPAQRMQQERYSASELEMILNEHVFDRTSAVVIEQTSSPEYMLVRKWEDRDNEAVRPRCLIDIRARLERSGTNLAHDAGLALKMAIWEGCLQKVAHEECDAAVKVDAVIVPDPYQPLILAHKARTTLDQCSRDEMYALAPQLLQTFIRCVDAGLCIFKFEANNILVDDGEKVYFNEWLYACKKDKLLPADLLRENMERFFLQRPALTRLDEILQAKWTSSGQNMEEMLAQMSMIAFVQAFESIYESKTLMDMAYATNHSLTLGMLDILQYNTAALDRQDWIPPLMDEFWTQVIWPTYTHSLKLKLHMQ